MIYDMSDSNLLLEITVPKYMREFKLSNKKMPVYYKRKDKLPKTFQTSDYSFYKFATLKEEILIHTATKTRIVKNANKVGKPNMKVISGQMLYNNELFGNARNLLMMQIKKMFEEIIAGASKINSYPIIIELEVHDVVYSKFSNNMLWDVGNRVFPYNKAFEDSLTFCGIIDDDNVLKITGPPRPLFYPIENEEERKLVYKIYKDTREIIATSYDYGNNIQTNLDFLNKTTTHEKKT
jgi:hypothetical protein